MSDLATPGGAVIGIPANVVSGAAVVHGTGTAIVAGVHLYKAGADFSPSTKTTANEKAGGRCEYCGKETTDSKQSQKGVSRKPTEGTTDHYQPKSKGGTNDPSNAKHSCLGCNLKKSNKSPAEWKKEMKKSTKNDNKAN